MNWAFCEKLVYGRYSSL